MMCFCNAVNLLLLVLLSVSVVAFDQLNLIVILSRYQLIAWEDCSNVVVISGRGIQYHQWGAKQLLRDRPLKDNPLILQMRTAIS